MRPSLLPGLIAAAQRNANRGFADLALFEVGQAYRGDAPEDQLMAASGVRAGAGRLTGAGRHWYGNGQTRRRLRRQGRRAGAARRAGLRRRRRLQITREAPAGSIPAARRAAARTQRSCSAHFGELHPRVSGARRRTARLPRSSCSSTPCRRRSGRGRAGRAGGRRPSAACARFCLRARRRRAGGRCREGGAGADKALIASVARIRRLRGRRPGAGKKSLALEVTLQPREKTLTDHEIEAVRRKDRRGGEESDGRRDPRLNCRIGGKRRR